MRTNLLNASIENVRKGPLVALPGSVIRTPRWLEFTVDGAGPYLARIRVELEGGRYVTTRYTLERAPGGPEIEAAAARAIPLRLLVSFGLTQIGANLLSGPYIDSDSPDLAQTAATIYQLAVLRGEPPAEAVAAHLGVSMATASKHIAAAKDEGLLRVSPIHKRGK